MCTYTYIPVVRVHAFIYLLMIVFVHIYIYIYIYICMYVCLQVTLYVAGLHLLLLTIQCMQMGILTVASQ